MARSSPTARDAVTLEKTGYDAVTPAAQGCEDGAAQPDDPSDSLSVQGRGVVLHPVERTAKNAVWSYEQPYDEVSVIKERLAL